MNERTRFRGVAVIGIAAVVLAASGATYLRLWPSTPSTPRPMPAFSHLPVSAEFRDLKAASDGSAWVFLRTTRGEALIYGTSDGGLSWRPIAMPNQSSNDKYGIQLIDKTHGFLQQGRGLLATADGGQTWSEASSITTPVTSCASRRSLPLSRDCRGHRTAFASP